MRTTVKCHFCQQPVLTAEAIKWNGFNYHLNCQKIAEERKAVLDYICNLFGLKAPGPVNFKLLKRYITENHMTYAGILKALKYFYEVQRHSTKQSGNRIGIVPYIYEEAQLYYKQINEATTKVTEAIEIQKQHSKEQENIKIMQKRKPRKEKTGYDLSSLWGEE